MEDYCTTDWTYDKKKESKKIFKDLAQRTKPTKQLFADSLQDFFFTS